MYAREISKKVFSIGGTVSPQNYIMIPHPQSISRNLGLIGRYFYVMIKSPDSSNPMSFHIDLKVNNSQ
jgi:hypothetical protein